jgi:hypothetical protein
MKHLYLASPSYHGMVTTGYCQSLQMTMMACIRAGIVLSGPDFKGGPYVEENRNFLVHRFLRSTADTLLFLDDDISWDENAVVKLYESGYDFCGGVYPRKQDEESFPCKLLEKWEGEYTEAMYIPGGFMMIRRKVFEMMDPHVLSYPEPCFDEPIRTYFQNVISTQGRVGEDVEFCNRWRILGGKVWCLTDIDFGHQGPKVWTGNLGQTLSLYEVKEAA